MGHVHGSMHFRLLTLFLLPLLTQALKFELYAQPLGHVTQRCIRNFVSADTLVVVTATLSGSKGDGQRVNIDVSPTVIPMVNARFEIQRATSMVVQGMSLVKREWRLHPTVVLRLMSVSKISFVKVCLYSQR
jgi:hypothetical protein